MSEYQYYQFLALDRPLTNEECAELRRLSSRAEITNTSFVNEYNWGDFRGDPHLLMSRYFDAFLYFANWGTRHLMFRIPAEALDEHIAELYCSTDSASVSQADGNLIISLYSDDEPGDDYWGEPTAELAAMVQARADLATGDIRLLYLGWLLAAQAGEIDDDAPEPPVPAGLGKLSASLKAVADFLRIDEDLLAVAAEASAAQPSRADTTGLSDWVQSLPDKRKTELLVQVADGQGARVRAELLREFRANSHHEAPAADTARTVSDLLTAADAREAGREAELARREQERKAREAAERAAALAERLDKLASRQQRAWDHVTALTNTTSQPDYDEAIALLKDLRALAEREGTQAIFAGHVRTLRERNRRKPSLLRRFDQASLPH